MYTENDRLSIRRQSTVNKELDLLYANSEVSDQAGLILLITPGTHTSLL